MKIFKQYIKGSGKYFIIGPLFKLLEAIFEVLVPLVMADIIDIGIENEDISYILQKGVVIVLLGVTGLLSAFVCQYMGSRASQNFGTKLRSSLFRHINSLSHAEIDKLGTHSLVTRLTTDIDQVQVAVAMFIRLAVRVPFLVIASTVMAMSIRPSFTLIYIAAILLICAALYFVMGRSLPLYALIQKITDKISLVTRENLAGARVIRAFGKEESENRRMEDAGEELYQYSIRAGKFSALLNPATSIISNLGIITILYFATGEVVTGKLLSGQVISLINYLTQIMLALIVLANLVVIFTKAIASAARLREILETKPSIEDSCHEKAPAKGNAPKICFRNVDFAYTEGKNSLSKISFEAYTGETIGIIGGTGSGKTTLLSLIPRFYDIASGEIEIDGIPVNRYRLNELRGKIGFVPQKAVLISGTIASNLRFADENASDEKLLSALKTAQAYDFVINKGLYSKVEQGGRNFSGGQRQRLSIARAITGNPEILILDDSTSALDFATEAALKASLAEYSSNTTTLIASQRINTVRNADRIIVLDEGRIAGIGTHEELLKNCPEYIEIFASQHGGSEK